MHGMTAVTFDVLASVDNAGLFKGNLYFSVHTMANGGGEVRGQILPASRAEFEARLTGAPENPPLAVAGTGAGSFTLTPHGLAFNITCEGLSGAITGAHIHSGARGVNGPVAARGTGSFG